jgi:Zn-dependent peptidase ImmA (M78 family)
VKPRYRKARSTATRLLIELKIRRPPVDPFAIAERLGIRVVQIKAPDPTLSGFMMRKEGESGEPVIGLNRDHAKTRQRFTVAHEVGHYLLHEWGDLRVDRSIVSFRDDRSGTAEHSEEIEANQFAAELLMPAQWIEATARTRRFDLNDDEAIRALASEFGVSQQAMTFRLANLGPS